MEKIATLRVDTKPLKIILLCVRQPTETGKENTQDIFYEELSYIYDKLPGITIKLIIENLYFKCGRVTNFMLVIGRLNLHEISNRNWIRLISFAATKYMVISNTNFPHKTTHKII